MPDDVGDILKRKRLVTAFGRRPAYQRNDYIGWIEEAKTGATRTKRIDQMLDELRAGNTYMKMAWRGNDKTD